MYTNGDRDVADTAGIKVVSYCVRGDATCGVGNPFTNPVGTFFYLVPGFYVHAFLTYRINEYDIAVDADGKKMEWDNGDTHYVVYDGGNPWGMMLRDLGIPVPKAADAVLSAIIPVPMPGQESTIAGVAVPTPRELQDIIFDALGLKVTVTDPDRNPDVRDELLNHPTNDTEDDSHAAPPAEATETTSRSGVVTNQVADDSENRSADHPSRDETEHTPGTADSDQTTTTDDTHKTGTETGDTGTNDTDAGDTDTSSDSGESTGTTDSDTAADSDGSDNSESDGNGSGTGDSGSTD